MKKFYYTVAGFEWVDSEAWGYAWKEAKAKAKELHTFVARRIVYKDNETIEIYAKGGAFIVADLLSADSVEIF